MRQVFLIVIFAMLAGCQGTPIGDAMIGEGKLAQMDDAYCQSIGAKPGSDQYMQCRMLKTAYREEGHRRAFQRAGAGIANASRAYGNSLQNSAATNRTINCTSTPSSSWVGGTASQVRTTCY